MILANGKWCPSCEFFEVDMPALTPGNCESCGCPEGIHVEAQVVVVEP